MVDYAQVFPCYLADNQTVLTGPNYPNWNTYKASFKWMNSEDEIYIRQLLIALATHTARGKRSVVAICDDKEIRHCYNEEQSFLQELIDNQAYGRRGTN